MAKQEVLIYSHDLNLVYLLINRIKIQFINFICSQTAML